MLACKYEIPFVLDYKYFENKEYRTLTLVKIYSGNTLLKNYENFFDHATFIIIKIIKEDYKAKEP